MILYFKQSCGNLKTIRVSEDYSIDISDQEATKEELEDELGIEIASPVLQVINSTYE